MLNERQQQARGHIERGCSQQVCIAEEAALPDGIEVVVVGANSAQRTLMPRSAVVVDTRAAHAGPLSTTKAGEGGEADETARVLLRSVCIGALVINSSYLNFTSKF